VVLKTTMVGKPEFTNMLKRLRGFLHDECEDMEACVEILVFPRLPAACPKDIPSSQGGFWGWDTNDGARSASENHVIL